ncbi:MAG: RnfABCDGE type electron transport complex subunit D [Pseudomonadota bacterium]
MASTITALSVDFRAWSRDARLFQIAALGTFLATGLATGAFDTSVATFVAVATASVATQAVLSKVVGVQFDPRSALITALSVTLLLRAPSSAHLALAGAVAIGSKFLIRLDGRHVFNPANFAVVAALAASPSYWTASGQWGSAFWLAAVLAGAGAIVTTKARRLDTPLIFLAVYAALILGRAIYLGDPLAIPLLKLQNGALALFAFFMLSDPMTTPAAPRVRAAFSAAAAALAFVLTQLFFVSDGAFYALFALCAISSVTNHLLVARAGSLSVRGGSEMGKAPGSLVVQKTPSLR